jgi:hypothetical protein
MIRTCVFNLESYLLIWIFHALAVYFFFCNKDAVEDQTPVVYRMLERLSLGFASF